MRLSERAEGGISNFERTVDGFLAGLPYERLLPALQSVNVNPLESPVADIELLRLIVTNGRTPETAMTRR